MFASRVKLSTAIEVAPVTAPLLTLNVPSVSEAPVILEFAFTVVKLPAPLLEPPIVAPSIVPPLISGEVIVLFVNV